MARKPTPSRATVFDLIADYFSKHFNLPVRSLRPNTDLRATLRVEHPDWRSLVSGLIAVPLFRANGLRISASEIDNAKTLNDLVALVHRKLLSSEIESPEPREAESTPAKKEKAVKSARPGRSGGLPSAPTS